MTALLPMPGLADIAQVLRQQTRRRGFRYRRSSQSMDPPTRTVRSTGGANAATSKPVIATDHDAADRGRRVATQSIGDRPFPAQGVGQVGGDLRTKADQWLHAAVIMGSAATAS
jgi:hypothetical protein